MSTLVPLPEANELWDEVNRYCSVMDRHLSMTDALYVEWTDRIAKFKDAGASALCRAIVHTVAGDAGRMEVAIGDARKADAPAAQIAETQLVSYSNLSYATKALGIFRKTVDVARLNLNQFIGIGAPIGAFSRIEELVAQAGKAGIDLSSLAQLPTWLKAAKILHARSFSDEECARVVDAAGEVLRDDELFWLDLSPRVVCDEVQGVVVIRFRVAATPAHAAEMTGRTVLKLIERGLDDAPLMINFVGTKH